MTTKSGKRPSFADYKRQQRISKEKARSAPPNVSNSSGQTDSDRNDLRISQLMGAGDGKNSPVKHPKLQLSSWPMLEAGANNFNRWKKKVRGILAMTGNLQIWNLYEHYYDCLQDSKPIGDWEGDPKVMQVDQILYGMMSFKIASNNQTAEAVVQDLQHDHSGAALLAALHHRFQPLTVETANNLEREFHQFKWEPPESVESLLNRFIDVRFRNAEIGNTWDTTSCQHNCCQPSPVYLVLEALLIICQRLERSHSKSFGYKLRPSRSAKASSRKRCTLEARTESPRILERCQTLKMEQLEGAEAAVVDVESQDEEAEAEEHLLSNAPTFCSILNWCVFDVEEGGTQ